MNDRAAKGREIGFAAPFFAAKLASHSAASFVAGYEQAGRRALEDK